MVCSGRFIFLPLRPGAKSRMLTACLGHRRGSLNPPRGCEREGGVYMRTIDIHAHLMPQCLWKTVDAGQSWHGSRFEPGAGLGAVVRDGKRIPIQSPKLRFTPEERLQDMDAQGVDVQVISIHTPLFGYDLDPAQGRQLARDVNDEIATMARQWPDRFAGLATLPVQDVGAAVEELDRAVHVLGLKGAELDTVMQGHNWDEPQFLPLFKAAEALGAVLFFHPQPQDNLLLLRTDKYGLANSIGVPVEDALVVATLIFGGILDACPALKDCITNSEAALRFLIDQVGVDRVVLGSDWPFVQWELSPVAWVQEPQSLTPEEKSKILWENLEQLLGL